MSKTIEVDISLKFVVTETGTFPPYEAKCMIAAIGADGMEWKGTVKYDDSRGPEDAIKTICRMDSFKATIPNLGVAALPAPEPKPAADSYSDMRVQLCAKKIGELRKIISDQNMDLTTGGKKKEEVVEQMIAIFKERDGVTVEN